MSIRSELKKNLLPDLANLAFEYDAPCDRVNDIKEHCSAGQYIHANPINTKQGLNCRNYCISGRKIEKFWSALPTMIRIPSLGLCFENLEPIDFYGTDFKGNVFPNIPNVSTLTGGNFLEWTIVYDTSKALVCSSSFLDAQSMINEYFRLGSSVEKEIMAIDDSRNIEWDSDRVTISRPENYILVIQSRSSSMPDIEMRD